MQLYALDRQGNFLHAVQAEKGIDYRCAECGGTLRLRGGIIFRRHFWHIQKGHCRQSGKGADHLAVQQWLLEQLPVEQAVMEKPFSTIGRVADIVWEKERIVIEVQCSQMSAEEAQKRFRDYEKAGWQLIWMLDRRRYRGYGTTELEVALQKQPHYYFELTRGRKVILYDLFQREDGSILEAMIEDVSSFSSIDNMQVDAAWPDLFNMRLTHWPLHFEGDFIAQYRRGNRQHLFKEMVLESNQMILPVDFLGRIKRMARLLFYHLLEKYCR